MGFPIEDDVNPDRKNRAIEISFSDKYNNEKYPSLVFNDNSLKSQLATIPKYLRIILGSKLYLNYWH